MTRYTRHQLIVLLVLLGAAGLGLAVGHWRRAHPDLVDRLEQFERTPRPASPLAPPAPVSRSPAPPQRERRSAIAPSAPGRGQASSELGAERRSLHSTPRPTSNEAVIDLNRANAAELTRLPGVGRALATRIVAARAALGPFATVDDLQRVPGLRRNKIDRLRPLVTAAP